MTPRQRGVLSLVASGYTISEIAKELWISENTVKDHIKNARSRLGARSRAHAVALAMREGEIE